MHEMILLCKVYRPRWAAALLAGIACVATLGIAWQTPPAYAIGPPTVAAEGATIEGSTSALLRASVNPNGQQVNACTFE